MEKQVNTARSKILRVVQAAVSFPNLPFSRRANKRIAHRLRTHDCKGFSGSFGPMIPPEARQRFKSSENQEPTSPRVSCMGHVMDKKPSVPPREPKPVKSKGGRPEGPNPDTEKRGKKGSRLQKIFGAGRKPDGLAGRDKAPVSVSGPGPIRMRKFASSRDTTFANIDWTAAQIAPEEDKEYYSEEEKWFSDEEDDVIVPFSAPMSVAGSGVDDGLNLERRKEINLWKRRASAQLEPLQLNVNK